MTNIEKSMICAIAACIIGIVISVSYLSNALEEAGGLKAVIIEAGKEVKDIGTEIQKD